MAEHSEYLLEPLREEAAFTLYRGRERGNPFFAIQFITELEQEGLLRFEPTVATWRWDIDRIHAKGHTANLLDLMVGKLSRFPDATQESLRQLACLGNIADFELLRTVYEDSTEEMHDQLWEAVRAGLIVRSPVLVSSIFGTRYNLASLESARPRRVSSSVSPEFR